MDASWDLNSPSSTLMLATVRGSRAPLITLRLHDLLFFFSITNLATVSEHVALFTTAKAVHIAVVGLALLDKSHTSAFTILTRLPVSTATRLGAVTLKDVEGTAQGSRIPIILAARGNVSVVEVVEDIAVVIPIGQSKQHEHLVLLLTGCQGLSLTSINQFFHRRIFHFIIIQTRCSIEYRKVFCIQFGVIPRRAARGINTLTCSLEKLIEFLERLLLCLHASVEEDIRFDGCHRRMHGVIMLLSDATDKLQELNGIPILVDLVIGCHLLELVLQVLDAMLQNLEVDGTSVFGPVFGIGKSVVVIVAPLPGERILIFLFDWRRWFSEGWFFEELDGPRWPSMQCYDRH
mmetsp:Transcript_4507/g.6404  ORF Transcript_4507/g.6404 Transcript_4507/m.6404 type:complete len:348 (+) Transcript_4507:713-1756(+)